MAWKYLQVGLAGSARISHTILHAQSVISLCTQCRAERVNLIYYTIRWCTILTPPPSCRTFEAIVAYCNSYRDLIPLSFVLGFYVSIVMTRWWNQYTSIPWPDPIAVFVSSNVHGQDERGRVMRRTIMRYVCLCLTMVLANVSPRVKKRFPQLTNLVEAGLLNENERTIIETMNKSFPRPSKHWLPIVWAASIITRARKEVSRN